jgi:hypothetical protein
VRFFLCREARGFFLCRENMPLAFIQGTGRPLSHGVPWEWNWNNAQCHLKNKAVGFGQRPRPLHSHYTRAANFFPEVFYTCFYNHAHRLRLEKLLYIELSRSSNGCFKPLLDPGGSPVTWCWECPARVRVLGVGSPSFLPSHQVPMPAPEQRKTSASQNKVRPLYNELRAHYL